MGIPNENTAEALKKLIACVKEQSGKEIIDFNIFFLMRDPERVVGQYQWGHLGAQLGDVSLENLLFIYEAVSLSIRRRVHESGQ